MVEPGFSARLRAASEPAWSRAVEHRFTVGRMADEYLALYRGILGGEIAP